jgi:hypothetical protein
MMSPRVMAWRHAMKQVWTRGDRTASLSFSVLVLSFNEFEEYIMHVRLFSVSAIAAIGLMFAHGAMASTSVRVIYSAPPVVYAPPPPVYYYAAPPRVVVVAPPPKPPMTVIVRPAPVPVYAPPVILWR